MAGASGRHRTPGTRRQARLGWAALLAVVAVLAFLSRYLILVRGGGVDGIGPYDDGVYYAAGAALLHGRMPYESFVLLHPPGVALLSVPFAWLGSMTNDAEGFVAARLAFMAMGALNAVLVAVIAGRFSRWSGALAGLLYATWYPAFYTERTISLEGPSTTLLLLALLVLARPPGRLQAVTARKEVVGGLLLGAMLGMKIWNVVPFLVVVGWQLVARGRRVAIRLLASAAAAAALMYVPFFVNQPGEMWRYVVLDQTGRPRAGFTWQRRMHSVLGINGYGGVYPDTAMTDTLAAALVLLVVATVLAWTAPGARVFVVLMAATVTVVLAGPSFFTHYTALTAAPIALVSGIGAGRLIELVRRTRAPDALGRLIGAVGLAVVLVAGIPALSARNGYAVQTSLATAAGETPGCVTADDPTTLILLDTLTRDLKDGCRIWVDVTGLTYDRGGGGGPGRPLVRAGNEVWQAKVMGYLLSGRTMVVSRAATGLDHGSKELVAEQPLLARSGIVSVYGPVTRPAALD